MTTKENITENTIRDFLTKLSVFPKNKGFFYITEALMIYTRSDEPWNLSIMKDIYPAVADKFRTTPAKAERNIRYTVNSIDIGDPPEIYREMFGTPKNGEHPTNAEFLTAATYMLTKNEAENR